MQSCVQMNIQIASFVYEILELVPFILIRASGVGEFVDYADE